MDNDQTKGIVSTHGFSPVDQSQPISTKSGMSDSSGSTGDKWGLSQVPKLFEYMESHFSFSASLLSIIGYVIIAAFGEMQTLGQYIGYLLFLGLVLFIYAFDKKDKRWTYFFIITTFVLINIMVFQNWGLITDTYKSLNTPFNLEIKPVESSQIEQNVVKSP